MSKRICARIIILMPFIFTNVVAQRPMPQQNDLDRRVADLTEQISREMTENRKRTIAVVEFVDLKGNTTDFGRLLSEELITRLFQTKKFTVIERQMLNKVIAEQKLTLTGAFEQSSARQLGRLLGVDAICSGTIGDLGQSLKVNARLISTETGALFAVASTVIFKDESVTRLLGGSSNSRADNKSGPTSSQAEKNINQSLDISGLTFELRSVKMVGTAVTCELNVTSNDRDREIDVAACEVCHPPRVIDDAGNEFRVVYVRLGDKATDYHSLKLLVAGVPVRLSLRFEGLPHAANKLALLNVNFWLSSNTLTAQFRNVAITK